jgi:hypothetical protein
MVLSSLAEIRVEENNASENQPNEDERYDRQMFRILRNIDLNLLTIFEAVYVHKGIVNAAKILNITPSAISQSINKLRALFPDPLFIRKGQGVTPTAYATHLHKYISQGWRLSQRPGFNRQYAAGTGDHHRHLPGYGRWSCRLSPRCGASFPRSCCTTSPLPTRPAS